MQVLERVIPAHAVNLHVSCRQTPEQALNLKRALLPLPSPLNVWARYCRLVSLPVTSVKRLKCPREKTSHTLAISSRLNNCRIFVISMLDNSQHRNKLCSGCQHHKNMPDLVKSKLAGKKVENFGNVHNCT